MKHFLDEKISAIVKNITTPFDCVNIRIECPLDTGIKVECKGQRGRDMFSPVIPGGVRIFFQFVEKMRHRADTAQFNVVDIKVSADGSYQYDVIFDEKVQNDAEENIRQD